MQIGFHYLSKHIYTKHRCSSVPVHFTKTGFRYSSTYLYIDPQVSLYTSQKTYLYIDPHLSLYTSQK